jgi:transcriptional regulator with XRE-family HTH domain
MNENTVLTQPQIEYLDWLSTAPSERTPLTKTALAEQLGVNRKTLNRWEQNKVFRDQWEQRVSAIQGSPERTQRLLDTLYHSALDGDTKSAQLYLQATNRMAPPTVEIKNEKRSADLSDDELDGLIAAMAMREKEQRKLKAV